MDRPKPTTETIDVVKRGLDKAHLERRAKEFSLPPIGGEGIIAYILDGRPTGSFLRAVLENDLWHAVERGDLENQVALPNYVKFIYNVAPIGCWGSVEQVDAWFAAHREWREKQVEKPEPLKLGSKMRVIEFSKEEVTDPVDEVATLIIENSSLDYKKFLNNWTEPNEQQAEARMRREGAEVIRRWTSTIHPVKGKKYEDRLVTQFPDGQRRGKRVDRLRCLLRDEVRIYVRDGSAKAVRAICDRIGPVDPLTQARPQGTLCMALKMLNTERYHNADHAFYHGTKTHLFADEKYLGVIE